MNEPDAGNWSPADHPYAIAVSEAQWWLRAATLAIGRLDDSDDPRSMPFSSRQIDARNLILALCQLLNAERLEQAALRRLGMDPVVGQRLEAARGAFQDALSGIKQMRDALTHFDEWALGEGRGEQRRRIRDGGLPRDVAREDWGFRYDSQARTVSMGSQTIEVDRAGPAAAALAAAVYDAALAVDKVTDN